MTTLAAALGKVLESFDIQGWVACPCCRLQWNKLRICQYWNDGHPNESALCVRCAEGANSLYWFKEKYPIPGGVDVKKKFVGTKPRDINGQIFPSMVEGAVSYGDGFYFLITSTGPMGIKVEQRGTTLVFFDNMFKVWFHLKQVIEKGESVEVKPAKRWGKKSKEPARSDLL